MCVVMHWNPFPLLLIILLAALGVTTLLLGLLIAVFRPRSQERRDQPHSRARVYSPLRSGWSKSVFSPLASARSMFARAAVPVYSVCRRTLNSAASVVRWKTPEKAVFDHEQLIHDARWQKFWRERVLPATSEHLQGLIPPEHFPVVRKSQLGTIVAYSVDYVKSMFAPDESKPSTTVGGSRERYVLVLRGPKTESEAQTEPMFKDVVTDMLQLKQVCGAVFSLCLHISCQVE